MRKLRDMVKSKKPDNLPCTKKEYEQFKVIHGSFSFFFDPKPEISDSEYSLRKTKLIHEVEDFWPTFQKLCKELDISLEIEVRPLFYTPAAKTNYYRAMCDRTDFVENKPISKRLLDLTILSRAIKSCTKSGQPEVNMWEISNNLAAKVSKEEALKCNQLIMRQIKKIFDELLIHLRKYFGEEIETQTSHENPEETKPDITFAKEKKEKTKLISSINIKNFTGILGDVKAENLQIGDNARIDKKPEAEKPTKTKQNRKTPIVAIIIFLIVDSVFELLVYFVPFTWLKNHPNSYGLQVSIIFLIPCLIVGLFKPQYRKWCWGVAGLAFLLLIVSLLGGRSR